MKRIALITLFWLSIFGLCIFLVATNEWTQCRIYGEETAYSDGFNEVAFRAIAKGQTKDHVRSALGEPLRIAGIGEGKSSWIYSQSPSESKIHNFRIRIVTFGSDGLVKQRETGLYVD